MLRSYKRLCPVRGCQIETLRAHFMCGKHWHSLPVDQRYAVNEAYLGYQRAILRKEGHQALIKAASELRKSQEAALARLGQ